MEQTKKKNNNTGCDGGTQPHAGGMMPNIGEVSTGVEKEEGKSEINKRCLTLLRTVCL